MKKVCRFCNELKSLDEFNKRAASKDGKSNKCKKCDKEATAIWIAKNLQKHRAKTKEWYTNHTKTHHVYLLPNPNYVGVTSYFKSRLNKHVYDGRDITDARLLATFNCRDKALELEEFLHDLGFEGRHEKGLYR